MSARTILIK